MCIRDRFPGFTLTFSTILAAKSAAFGVKWISATKGVVYPADLRPFFIFSKFWASLTLGAVILTNSQPLSIILIHCSIDPVSYTHLDVYKRQEL